jgi:ABC-type uncharacterized transport system ATPase component
VKKSLLTTSTDFILTIGLWGAGRETLLELVAEAV